MTIKFTPLDPSQNVTRVSHGEYSRDFTGETAPYEADIDEWQKFLKPTGQFELVENS